MESYHATFFNASKFKSSHQRANRKYSKTDSAEIKAVMKQKFEIYISTIEYWYVQGGKAKLLPHAYFFEN